MGLKSQITLSLASGFCMSRLQLASMEVGCQMRPLVLSPNQAFLRGPPELPLPNQLQHLASQVGIISCNNVQTTRLSSSRSRTQFFLCIPTARPHAGHKRRALYRPSCSSRHWKALIFFLKVLLFLQTLICLAPTACQALSLTWIREKSLFLGEH